MKLSNVEKYSVSSHSVCILAVSSFRAFHLANLSFILFSKSYSPMIYKFFLNDETNSTMIFDFSICLITRSILVTVRKYFTCLWTCWIARTWLAPAPPFLFSSLKDYSDISPYILPLCTFSQTLV